jgi:hypothetical protein
VGIDMNAWSDLNFKASRYQEMEKLVQEFTHNSELLAGTLVEYGFSLNPDEGHKDIYRVYWEGEKYHEAAEELLKAMAPAFEEGSCIEGTINSEDRFMWKVINGKLVDMVHIDLWFEPNKVPVCPECGTPLDMKKG